MYSSRNRKSDTDTVDKYAVFVLDAPAQLGYLWEALRLRCVSPHHRDFTSAGFSASPVGKYHYYPEYRRRLGYNPGFGSGILAALLTRSRRTQP